jgi:hypothetical protein
MAENLFEKAATNFVLMGTVHRDEEGPALLSRWLERLVPDVVTVEFSLYGLQFRAAHREEFRQKISGVAEAMRSAGKTVSAKALSGALAFADVPYEYEAASGYCRALGKPCYPIDLDIFSRRNLEKASEFVEEENLKRLLGTDDGDGGSERAMARLYFTKGIKDGPYTEEMHLRDRYMSRRIAALMRYHTGARFLHVTGWRHLEDPQGLYDALKPMKVFLHDTTLCF